MRQVGLALLHWYCQTNPKGVPAFNKESINLAQWLIAKQHGDTESVIIKWTEQRAW